ncbi:MAG TPA: PDZ domain-containing protein, partial [Caldimonas sp.]|nr:PDZ domain-containing protein [Caldimonas sp.]
DMQTVVSQMAESGALGDHPEQTSLRLDVPARRVASLGALVDSTSAQSARDGLHVLGATPGSAADRIGLRPGDVIVAVNGTSLRDLGADEHGRALAAATLRSVIDALPDAATVSLDVVRGGSTVALSAPLQAVHVPAMRVELGEAATLGGASSGPDAAPAGSGVGCGRISGFDVAPRGQRLYGVRLILIDGSSPGPFPTPSFRVAPGEHHVLVAENIPTQALGIGEIATLRRQTSKPLTVVVQPGKTAMVAAQLHLSNASDLSHGTYWDPVVWRQADEPCG